MLGTFPGARARLRTAVLRLRAGTCFGIPLPFAHAGVGRDCAPVLRPRLDGYLVGSLPQCTRISTPTEAGPSNAPAAKGLAAGGAPSTALVSLATRPASSRRRLLRKIRPCQISPINRSFNTALNLHAF